MGECSIRELVKAGLESFPRWNFINETGEGAVLSKGMSCRITGWNMDLGQTITVVSIDSSIPERESHFLLTLSHFCQVSLNTYHVEIRI